MNFKAPLLALIVLTSLSAFGQSWSIVNPSSINSTGSRDIVPVVYKTYTSDDVAMRDLLWSAPHESEVKPSQSNTIISVPSADGSLDQYRMVQYDMMEAPLAAQYPHIRTFHGVSVTDPHKRIRADYTDYGFRAEIRDEKGHSYIDHFQRGDNIHKVVYYKKDLENKNPWSCEVQQAEDEYRDNHGNDDRVGDCVFRSYRLALATTGEYSNFHGATSSSQSSLVMTAVVNVMNRVNGVLESDVTIRFVLVGNTSSLFYYTPGSDPYTNNNGVTMLTENQTNCDNIIGTSNYDMGHVFSTGGGGVASLGAICSTNNKARGVTGLPSPIGDAFSIDYVAHEMGHQLGGNHTFNNTNNGSCSGNGNSATRVEPGSGSTIMAYAGICSPTNVQSNSDAYYHAVSLSEIKTKLQSVSCHTIIPFTNQPPVVSALTNFSIPISTPFILTANATDGDGDPITYCWEQTNTGSATTAPTATMTSSAVFRSLSPVSSPSRYFPSLTTVLAGNTANTWEVVPSVGRTLNFRATVRDYHLIAGCTDEENMTVTTVAGIGPFIITSQNTASNLTEGAPATITWNVANTTNSPVNCASVNIILSYDGGLTYPVTLATGTANDGTETVTLPLGTSTTARIMVRAANNVFYDVNNANITIIANPATFNLSLEPGEVVLCNTGQAQSTVSVSPVNGFTQNVTLSALNLPPGAVASFSTNPVAPNASSVMTISNLTGADGTYNVTVRGTSGSIIKDVNLVLIVQAPLAAPTLIAPASGTTGVWYLPDLSWNGLSGAAAYNFEVSLSSSFSFLAASGNAGSNAASLNLPLLGQSTYFWRVRGVNNCANNPWSAASSFSTDNCMYYKSGDIPQTISSGAPSTVESQQFIFDRGRLTTAEIYDLEGQHTNVDNLKFFLRDPLGTELLFWDQPCNGEDNFNINLSDAASSSAFPCPPTNGMSYKPTNPFSLFQDVNPIGNWKLKVQDVATGDGGFLTNWGWVGCYNGFCHLQVEHPYSSGIGSLLNAVSCAQAGDTIYFNSSLKNLTLELGTSTLVINQSIVLKANPADNISISTNASSSPTVEVTPGQTVTLIGLNIKASGAADGAIRNAGNLNLVDIDLIKNPSVTHTSLLRNQGAGTVSLTGACTLKP
ncbi:MAG: propanediol utilization protein [Saprospiraceae bacterium]|nr:propanediol utilization protein [Saprospiraceae bacterium]